MSKKQIDPFNAAGIAFVIVLVSMFFVGIVVNHGAGLAISANAAIGIGFGIPAIVAGIVALYNA